MNIDLTQKGQNNTMTICYINIRVCNIRDVKNLTQNILHEKISTEIQNVFYRVGSFYAGCISMTRYSLNGRFLRTF